MTPATSFIGDYNNIFAFGVSINIVARQKSSRWNEHIIAAIFSTVRQKATANVFRTLRLAPRSTCSMEKISSWEPSFKVTFAKENGVTKQIPQMWNWARLNVRVSDSELKSGLLKYLFNTHDRANVTPLDLRAGLSKKSNDTLPADSLFHLDGDGNACFTRDQAELASDYIAEMQLDVKVKASLQKKKFDLPHRSVRMYPLSTVTTTDMVKLMCCGYVGCCASRKKAKSAVRNEKGAEDDTNKQEFDAWPSERHEKRWITPSVLLQSIW
eukprot:CAMPEP_0201963042 /NCGR_PEP_ID=MMETSP0904-20121228/9028_1 /ASSEMBLY_ACC=CAM_ASM_000553 /TAXON_ID=420261 /ORGANISM="Thalassiosira antarctica, Strain CCMP982" /LENGTH=268 /DNA_ID=CAMNT_0048509565 /DNA_START=195 /DNA_END=1000 /DNA_ORIENTATION=+